MPPKQSRIVSITRARAPQKRASTIVGRVLPAISNPQVLKCRFFERKLRKTQCLNEQCVVDVFLQDSKETESMVPLPTAIVLLVQPSSLGIRSKPGAQHLASPPRYLRQTNPQPYIIAAPSND